MDYFASASIFYHAIIILLRFQAVQDTSLSLLNATISVLPVNFLFIASGILLLKNKDLEGNHPSRRRR